MSNDAERQSVDDPNKTQETANQTQADTTSNPPRESLPAVSPDLGKVIKSGDPTGDTKEHK